MPITEETFSSFLGLPCMLTAFHLRQEIFAMFREALGMDRAAVVIRARDLHGRVDEYPGPHQRMSPVLRSYAFRLGS